MVTAIIPEIAPTTNEKTLSSKTDKNVNETLPINANKNKTKMEDITPLTPPFNKPLQVETDINTPKNNEINLIN